MDAREGMLPSFYLNRGFRGSSSNVGSGHPGGGGGGGGFHVPPPGFKTQPNPNMRSAPSMGSPFHMEHNPPPSFPHGINIGVVSGVAGGGSDDAAGGGGGGVAVTPVTLPNPVSGSSESIVKKKRGRPRKYTPDGSHMALGLTPVSSAASPEQNTPAPNKKRGRPKGSGRKQRLANVGEWMHNSAGSAFTPHVIHISVGEDVAEKILLFAQQRQRALCVLSGNGSISSLTLRQFTSSGGTVTYEGRFEILCLSGSYLLAETGSPRNRAGGLSISVCKADGQVIGGAIGGKLVASSLVQVVVCSFLYSGGDNSKAKPAIEPPSGDEKRPGVQLN